MARFTLTPAAAETMARRRRSTLLVTLAMTLLLAPAFAQSSGVSAMTNRCILQLRAPSLSFNESLRGTKWNALAHSDSGRYWLIESSSSCASLTTLVNVERSDPAELLIVTLKDGEGVPEKQIEELGGVVTGKLRNLNVLTVAVPASAASRLAQIPGVLRVQRDRSQTTTDDRKK